MWWWYPISWPFTTNTEIVGPWGCARFVASWPSQSFQELGRNELQIGWGVRTKKNFPSKLRILLSFTYPLVNVYIANWKDPPFFIGKTHYFYDHVPQLFVCLPEGEFPWHPINPMENPRKNGHCFREFSHSKCSLVEASFTQTGCVIRHQETEWPLCIGRSVPSSPGLRQADAK